MGLLSPLCCLSSVHYSQLLGPGFRSTDEYSGKTLQIWLFPHDWSHANPSPADRYLSLAGLP